MAWIDKAKEYIGDEALTAATLTGLSVLARERLLADTLVGCPLCGARFLPAEMKENHLRQSGPAATECGKKTMRARKNAAVKRSISKPGKMDQYEANRRKKRMAETMAGLLGASSPSG